MKFKKSVKRVCYSVLCAVLGASMLLAPNAYATGDNDGQPYSVDVTVESVEFETDAESTLKDSREGEQSLYANPVISDNNKGAVRQSDSSDIPMIVADDESVGVPSFSTKATKASTSWTKSDDGLTYTKSWSSSNPFTEIKFTKLASGKYSATFRAIRLFDIWYAAEDYVNNYGDDALFYIGYRVNDGADNDSYYEYPTCDGALENQIIQDSSNKTIEFSEGDRIEFRLKNGTTWCNYSEAVTVGNPSTPEEPTTAPDLLSKVKGFMNDKNYNNYLVLEATRNPAAGKTLYAYEKTTSKLWGASSTSSLIKVAISNSYKDAFEGKSSSWAIVEASSIEEAAALTLPEPSAAGYVANSMVEDTGYSNDFYYAGKWGVTTSPTKLYDKIVIKMTCGSAYAPISGIHVYKYNTSTKVETFYKTVSVASGEKSALLEIKNLKPGTNFTYKIYPFEKYGGMEYGYDCGSAYNQTSANFVAGTVKPVKVAGGKVLVDVSIPVQESPKGYCQVIVYKGSKKIKTINSSGKTSVSFTHKAKKAESAKYKAKYICSKYKSIKKTSAAKKPVSDTCKWRTGTPPLNPDSYCSYGNCIYVPWSVSYWNGKLSVKGRFVNNRMFKLKKAIVKVTVYDYRNVKIAEIKKTVKNYKAYGNGWMTLSKKIKSTPNLTKGSSYYAPTPNATWF